MENKECYLCGSKNTKKIHNGTRDNASVDVMECIDCGLVFLSSFSHIQDNVYEESGMHKGTIDIVKYREATEKDDKRRSEMLKDVIANKDVLDFGCGNGGFLKFSKNKVNKIIGIELEKQDRDYLTKEGYTVFKDICESKEKFDVITMFHVLEHLKEPITFLDLFKEKLNNNGEIIIEVPNSNDALLSLYNSDAFADFTYWSFHLFVYNESTIARLAELAGLKIKWMKQIQRYSLANHLYWLSENKPGGHVKWPFLDDSEINSLYAQKLSSKKACDTLMISLTR